MHAPAGFGAALLVGFVLPGGLEPLLISGTVRWTTPNGIGVQFGPLGAPETYAITEVARGRGERRPRRTS